MLWLHAKWTAWLRQDDGRTDGRTPADVCSTYPVPDACYNKLRTKTSVMQPQPTEAVLFLTTPSDPATTSINSATPVDDSLTSADDSATRAARFATSSYSLEPTTGATASLQGCVEAIWYDSYRDKLLMTFTGNNIVSLYPKDTDSIVQNISTSETTRHAYCTSLPGGVNDIYFMQTYSLAYYMVLESE